MADNYTGQPIINASGNTVGEGILKTTGSLVITNIIGSVNINGNPANWTGVGSVFAAGGSLNIQGTPSVNAFVVSGNAWTGVGSVLVTGSVNIAGTPSANVFVVSGNNWTGVGSVFGAGGSFNTTVLGSVAITNTVPVSITNESTLVDRNTFFSGGAVAAGGSFTHYYQPNAAGSLFVKSVEYTASVPLKAVVGFSGVTNGSVQGRFAGVGFAATEELGRVVWDQDFVFPSGTGSVLEINLFNRSLTLAADVYGKWSAGQAN